MSEPANRHAGLRNVWEPVIRQNGNYNEEL